MSGSFFCFLFLKEKGVGCRAETPAGYTEQQPTTERGIEHEWAGEFAQNPGGVLKSDTPLETVLASLLASAGP